MNVGYVMAARKLPPKLSKGFFTKFLVTISYTYMYLLTKGVGKFSEVVPLF